MSKTDTTTARKGLALLLIAVLLTVILGVGLVLRDNVAGNVGNGFLIGAGIAIVVALVTGWRVTFKKADSTPFERAFTSQGDERDDAVLTRSLAVLGLTSLPLTGAATIAIAMGAETAIVLVCLMAAQALTGVIAFVVTSRRT